MERESGRAEVDPVPSSASSSSSTPVSWHFLLWAFDFMCLVRFPGKKREQTHGLVSGREQRGPGCMKAADAARAQLCRQSAKGWAGQGILCPRVQPDYATITAMEGKIQERGGEGMRLGEDRVQREPEMLVKTQRH